MDYPGLAEFLKALGPPGVIIGYLLWERRDLQARLHASQEAHMADMKKAGADVTSALVTSTELMRANNTIQDRAAHAASALAEAMRGVQQTLEHLDEAFERERRA